MKLLVDASQMSNVVGHARRRQNMRPIRQCPHRHHQQQYVLCPNKITIDL